METAVNKLGNFLLKKLLKEIYQVNRDKEILILHNFQTFI